MYSTRLFRTNPEMARIHQPDEYRSKSVLDLKKNWENYERVTSVGLP